MVNLEKVQKNSSIRFRALVVTFVNLECLALLVSLGLKQVRFSFLKNL
jgi:hypothetical protein